MFTLDIGSRDYTSYKLVSKEKTIEGNDPSVIKGFFHNDIVKFNETKELTLHNRSSLPTRIAGELELYSKYSFKPNKKGVPTYIFTPIDYRYPKFLVSSTLKRNRDCNQYVSIEYSTWEKDSLFPKANIVKIYGNIYDKKALQEILVQNYFLENKNIKHDFKGILLQFNKMQENIINREYLTSKILSIDPEKCTDIDDGFSIEQNGDTLTLDIHISDVYYILNKLELLDKVSNVTSIYLQEHIQHMLPTSISSGIGSLLEGQLRFMISLKIIYSISKQTVMSAKIRPTYGTITKNYTYENYPKRIDKYFRHVQTIYKRITGQMIEIDDSHRFIEALMIIYNTAFCKKLQDAAFAIYRTQAKRREPLQDVLGDTKLNSFMNLITSYSAEYSLDTKGHDTLNINNYTHATSPLRRIVDLINQEIFYTTESTLLNRIELDYINSYNKRLKRCYRDIGKVILGHNVYYGNSYNTKCCIYQYHLKKKYIYLYFPDENVSIKTKLFSQKVDSLYHIELLEKNKHIKITDANYVELAVLPLYSNIDVTINGKPNIYYPDESIIVDFGGVCLC